MGDSVGGVPPNKPQGLDDLMRPDAGFHDDKVGSEVKHQEAAQRRAALQAAQRKPQRLVDEQQEVGALSKFRSAHEERAGEEQRRSQRALVAGRPPPKKKSAHAGAALELAEQQVIRLEARVATMLQAMAGLARELAEADGLPAEGAETAKVDHARVEAPSERDQRQGGGRQAPEPPSEAQGLEDEDDRAAIALRLRRTTQDVRHCLQDLIVGGLSPMLGEGPQAGFKRMFARLEVWPKEVPPGCMPERPEDYDAFLSWVFAPAEQPAELALELQP